MDDHSRYLLHISAHHRVTGKTVVDTFPQAHDTHGLPQSTLTDNGMVYTTRLAAGGRDGTNYPNAFETFLADLHTNQKNVSEGGCCARRRPSPARRGARMPAGRPGRPRSRGPGGRQRRQRQRS